MSHDTFLAPFENGTLLFWAGDLEASGINLSFPIPTFEEGALVFRDGIVLRTRAEYGTISVHLHLAEEMSEELSSQPTARIARGSLDVGDDPLFAIGSLGNSTAIDDVDPRLSNQCNFTCVVTYNESSDVEEIHLSLTSSNSPHIVIGARFVEHAQRS